MEHSLKTRFLSTRKASEDICSSLAIEDYSVQPIADVSPPKWHLAHSTWFFEQFVLTVFDKTYSVFSEDFAFLFNSYYNNAGERVLRPNRGLMTRPTVEEVLSYRAYVSKSVVSLLEINNNPELLKIVEVGINHEQQHQELLAYDIKYILGNQPSFPEYKGNFHLKPETPSTDWVQIKEGVYTIGHIGEGYSFDNEHGAHKVYLQNTEISPNLVTNGEWLEFIEAGGYDDFNLWHAEGWDFIQKNEIKAPLYWFQKNGDWLYYDFSGLKPVDPTLPVMHISYYEAFAFAEWKGMRLPTEFEWEIAAPQLNYGQTWEWTGSAYLPYPSFTKEPGALGEYNGKFMVNLHVLRGASIATPQGHSRDTYRNFFHPSSRWLFAGLRLAR
ncbi:ergothioneine biosynthesis protein EgtB [Spirosomataceae bacterium TFI 002]|nr:ergothioneine biosynthesis protein EgtB [Spirosomataceae bacterium TFI 002]